MRTSLARRACIFILCNGLMLAAFYAAGWVSSKRPDARDQAITATRAR